MERIGPARQSIGNTSTFRLLGNVLVVVSGAFAFAVLAFCGGRYGWFLGGIAVGCAAAVVCASEIAAVAVATLAGALGGAWSAFTLALPGLDNVSLSAALDIYRRDINNDFYYGYVRALAAASPSETGGKWTLALLGAVACGGAAYLSWRLVRLERLPVNGRTIVGAIAVGAAVLILWIGALNPTTHASLEKRSRLATYAGDADIYWRAYDGIRAGRDYYPALVAAASRDIRVRSENDVVGGRFRGWAPYPALIRMPYLYRTLALFAPAGVFEVQALGLLLATAILIGAYAALLPRLGAPAVWSVLFVVPYLQGSLIWDGLFFPDLWAGLLVTLGLLAWSRNRYLLGGGLVLAASLCRETALFALVIMLGWALWRAVTKRGAWVARSVWLAAMCGAFFGCYALALRWATPFTLGAASGSATSTVMVAIERSARRSLAEKVLLPAAFGTFLYRFLGIEPIIFVLAQVPGWFLALRDDHDALVPVLGFAVFWLLFTGFLGATSSYWGLIYMPIAFIGSGALVAWSATRLLRPASEGTV